MPHHLLDGREAQVRHDLAQLLGNEEHEALDVFGLAREPAPQAAVLGRDAGGAGVLLAVALHETAHGDERHGGEAEFLGAQQARHGDVGAVHELAVGLEDDARAKAVLDEGLLSLGQAELEWQPGVPDGVARGCAGAAVVAADQDLVGGALGHAGGDGAHARLAHKLDADARGGIGTLEIENQLGEVLDGVDVVVGRGRDESDAGGRAAHLGDPGVDLLAGQMAALAGFGALGHLDLDLGRARQVAARHAEAPARHLLDGGIPGVAVGKRRLASRVLAALA